MNIPDNTLAVVMAGGAGSRLAPLTLERAKPAVPFGGQYRIIDFTLSNCLHSGLRRILVLTQYKSHSMQKHLRDGWSIFSAELGEYVTAVPPQMRTGDSWYAGTADAIYQNRYLIKRSGAKYVLVLSGDHIYRMDYAPMLRQHKHTAADLTIACMEVDIKEASSFGVISINEQKQIYQFEEKPKRPPSLPDRPDRALASMGIYVFSADMLCEELLADHHKPESTHDFGNDLIPRLIKSHKVYGHRFDDFNGDSKRPYSRDVGTIDSYFAANMDLLANQPPIDLHSQRWRIRNYNLPTPPARICNHAASGELGIVSDSILSEGVVVNGGDVEHSILSPEVRVGPGAIVQDSILFHDVRVGAGVKLQKCIIDKHVVVPAGEMIGVDPLIDAERFTISPAGIVVVPKGYRFEKTHVPSHSRVPAPASERRRQSILNRRSSQNIE